ncbi:MAG: flippase-like domain-containing protein [Aquificota bacterium]|jgi:uncharacterized protein (TIRG00374 family)
MPFLYILFWGGLATFLFVLFSFLILIFKFSHCWDWKIFLHLDYFYILAAFGLIFLYHTFDMLRLKTIAEVYNIKYSTLYGYLMSFIATFGATITPAHVGGELIIFYLLHRLRVKRHKIVGTIIFKTVSGFSFFLITLPILFVNIFKNPHLLDKVLILAAIFILFGILSLPLVVWLRKKEENKQGFLKKIKLYCLAIIYFWKKDKVAFLKACLYSIMLYVIFLNFAPVLLKALRVDFDLWEIYLLQLPLIYAIFSSPSPGGSGVGELGGIAIFQGIIPPSLLGIFVILWRFFSQYFSAIVGGILFIHLLLKDIHQLKKERI